MTGPETMDRDLARAVADNPLWYHSIELAPGLVTPGWFDLRPVLDRLPWPDVRGLRCLDVGTYDGHLAFELERRGAGEVVALDVPDHRDWDWPPDVRAVGPEGLARMAGPEKGAGFRIAARALGSRVQKVDMTVYELGPERMGTFDVVVCGSLLLHLRDPLRALEAIRSVCGGRFMSSEEIDLSLSLRYPRRPVARLDGSGPNMQWWVPNVAGHRRMVFAAGFAIERATRPYSDPFGESHPGRKATPRSAPVHLARTLLTGNPGVPHAALLARPRV
jgi:tRNA (mo5U34)-methyltransferase